MPPVYPKRAADLSRDWAARVAGNRAQAERLREAPDGGDHYAPLASAFRADPHRRDDPTLNALKALANPNDVWLDIGAGAGRFSLALAGAVREVIAIEPSPAMRAEFAALQVEHGIFNARIINQRWPADDPPSADVALISHVGYDIEPIGAFLDTMERAARRECVAVLYNRAPGGFFRDLWPEVHGEAETALPGLDDLIALLQARGAEPVVERSDGRRWSFDSPDDALAGARRRLWLEADSPKLPQLRAALERRLVQDDDGRYSLPSRLTLGIVRWRPTLPDQIKDQP